LAPAGAEIPAPRNNAPATTAESRRGAEALCARKRFTLSKKKYLTRERSEDFIYYLAARFPKCFFVDPSQRRPLKHDIIDDLEEQRCLDRARLEQAIDWYGLQKGGPRIDLNGNQAGVVTPQEAQEASAWITAQKRTFGRP
jgi:sRNA-binding protein